MFVTYISTTSAVTICKEIQRQQFNNFKYHYVLIETFIYALITALNWQKYLVKLMNALKRDSVKGLPSNMITVTPQRMDFSS